MKNLEYLSKSLTELLDEANKTRKKYNVYDLEICSIMNAKSGKCSEDCAYCAQSSFNETNAKVYPLKSEKEIIEKAIFAEKNGADRFGIVTSGNNLSDEEIEIISRAIKYITENFKIKVCGSLGNLSIEKLEKLKVSGMDRYHHNIETSKSFYKKIVSTHSFEDRIETIKRAKSLGFSVCSGGILGLGEYFEDRIEMANILSDLDVDSVPINILIRIDGIKLSGNEPMPYIDIIKTIAIFRIILKDKNIRFCGGRELNLKDFQGMGFLAGANGIMIGGYLTNSGRDISDDQKLIVEVKRLFEALKN